MDIANGVVKRGSIAKAKNKQILLCEFKFNYKNHRNISKSEIDN